MRTVIFETLRRELTSGVQVFFVLCITLVAMIIGAANGPSRIWQNLLYIVIVILGAQLIGPEFSSGTLQLILAKPIRRWTYLVGRVFGVILTMWVAIFVPFMLDFGARAVFPDDSVDWGSLFAGTVNLGLSAALVAAFMAFLGSFTRSYLNAAIYFGGQAILSMLVGLLGFVSQGSIQKLASLTAFLQMHPAILDGLRAFEENLYPTAPLEFSLPFTLVVLSNTAVALTLACLVFRRREVPYGAD